MEREDNGGIADTNISDPAPLSDPLELTTRANSNSNSKRTRLSKLWKWSISWTPPAWSSTLLGRILIPTLTWTILYLLLGDMALPGSSVFSICIILYFGIVFGQLFSYIRLPPLLGMLTLGILLRNSPLPNVNYGTAVPSEISSILRQMALVVILIRAGLGLDPQALMRLKGVVIRLAFCPCVAEAVTIAIASHFILSFPWLWGLILGFVLAAVSPAVIVPSLLTLREQGYGVKKGIPTIVIAASSVDDILAISAFGLVLGLNFAQRESTLESVMQGPLELILGIGFGILWGCLLGILFSYQDTTAKANCVIVQVILTLGGGCLSVFGFQKIGFPGSGPLGCLTATFVAAIFWRQKGVLSDINSLTETFSILWFVFQPLLFGLIGCEIDFMTLDPTVALLGVVCLVIGLTIRLLVTFVTVAHAGLNFKERLFVSIAWVPKATVQAAIGPIALDTARSLGAGKESEHLGLQVLTIAVLAILITAPIGATAVTLLGPRLLSTDKLELRLNGDVERQQDNQAQDEADIPLQSDHSKSNNTTNNLPNGEGHITE